MQANKIYKIWFVIPAVALYTILFTIPVISGVGYSLTDWNINRSNIHFIGLENYQEIFFSTGPYLSSIIHTTLFTVITVIFKSILGLVLALLLNEGIKSKNQLRTVFFIPYTLSPLIIGIIFESILSPEGPINMMLRQIGLGKLEHAWLSETGTALMSTMGVEIWRMVGWNMVIFLAGLQMIPKEYYEAASIDGANKWNQFKSITLQFLMPSITITIILNTIHGLRVFDIIYSLTGGGPGILTEVINTQVFKEFTNGRYGMSNALSAITLIITLFIALTMKKVLTGGEEDK